MFNVDKISYDSSVLTRFDKTKIISLASGKGGVGKTTIVSNLAVSLSENGQRVLILDGDLGMANVDVMFNCRSRKTLMDIFDETTSLKDILIEVHPNVFLIPGGSGIYELRNIDNFQKRSLMDEVHLLANEFDFLLIDTAPGIDDNVLYLNAASEEIIVVINSDPASMTDSYALIKMLNKKFKINKFSVLCNCVQSEREAYELFQRLSHVAEEFLFVSLDYKGFVPMDQNLQKATKQQQLISKVNPRSQSSYAFNELSKNLSGFNGLRETKGGIQFFWSQLVGMA